MNSAAPSIEMAGENLEWVFADPFSSLRQCRFEMAAAGRLVFDLSMLNPDLPPPRLLLDKLLEASLNPANHRYAVSRGIRKLRESFACKYERRFRVPLDPHSQVCVTMGTKDALLQALTVLRTVSNRLVIGAPSYPAHLSAARLAGFQCSYFELAHDEDKMLSSLRSQLDKARGQVLLLNFPNNPTGIIVSRRFYEGLLPVVKQHRVIVLNDFVYGEMCFGSLTAPSMLEVRGLLEHGAETYSLSKAYSVPGWRVGAIAGQSRLVHQVSRLKAHADYGLFLPLQMASAAALTGPAELVRPACEAYRERSQVLAAGLAKLGWELKQPSAGASIWAALPGEVLQVLDGRLPPEESRSLVYTRLLLRYAGVMFMPGAAYGAQFDNYCRVALVKPSEELREVLERLRGFDAVELERVLEQGDSKK